MIEIDWDKIPKEYNWVAVDEDGEMLAYATQPEKRVNSYWIGQPAKYLGTVNLNNVDWQDTLTRRPAAQSNK